MRLLGVCFHHVCTLQSILANPYVIITATYIGVSNSHVYVNSFSYIFRLIRLIYNHRYCTYGNKIFYSFLFYSILTLQRWALFVYFSELRMNLRSCFFYFSLIFNAPYEELLSRSRLYFAF